MIEGLLFVRNNQISVTYLFGSLMEVLLFDDCKCSLKLLTNLFKYHIYCNTFYLSLMLIETFLYMYSNFIEGSIDLGSKILCILSLVDLSCILQTLNKIYCVLDALSVASYTFESYQVVIGTYLALYSFVTFLCSIKVYFTTFNLILKFSHYPNEGSNFTSHFAILLSHYTSLSLVYIYILKLMQGLYVLFEVTYTIYICYCYYSLIQSDGS